VIGWGLVPAKSPALLRWREDSPVREAAWVARCVGDPQTAPLTEKDLKALASYLQPREFERGALVFREGEPPDGVWIVRSGMIAVGRGSKSITEGRTLRLERSA
jgi:CRP-like cAMP-binding protein